MSYKLMNEQFISNEPQLTQIFEYAIQDVVVLYKIFEKTQIFTKLINIAKLFDCSVYDVLHKTDTTLCQLKLQ